MCSVRRENRAEVSYIKKAIYSPSEIKSYWFFSKLINKVIHWLFTHGFEKIVFKWNTAYSQWQSIELK